MKVGGWRLVEEKSARPGILAGNRGRRGARTRRFVKVLTRLPGDGLVGYPPPGERGTGGPTSNAREADVNPSH